MAGTHLTHLEQRPVISGDYLLPDFLARFQPGCTPGRKTRADSGGFRCFVEVKSTTKDKFKIGGQKLRRLRRYADQFGLPLVFAVRFLRFGEYALWIMVEDTPAKNSIAVTYSGLTDGVRHVLRDDYMLMVYPWIFLRAVYDAAVDPDSGVRHTEYGTLREFHIVSHPDHTISGPTVVDNAARFDGITGLTLSAFFEGFRPEQVAVRRDGTVTVQLLRPTVPCSIADMVYSFNRLPRDEHGRALFDPSRILAGSDSDAGLITRQFIDRITSDLWHSVLGIITFGEPELQLQKWERLCGNPQRAANPVHGTPDHTDTGGR